MNASKMTLWQMIDALLQQMPLSPDKIKALMGVPLKETERSESFVLFAAPGTALKDSSSISIMKLMIRPSMEFDSKSAFGFELGGNCISLEDVRKHYADVQVTQAPRGRSLEETTVHSARRPAGTVSFAFKEEKPECLFSVSIRTPVK